MDGSGRIRKVISEAREALRALGREHPNDPRPPRALGRLLSLEGRAREAEAAYREALVRAPGDVETTRLLEQLVGARGAP